MVWFLGLEVPQEHSWGIHRKDSLFACPNNVCGYKGFLCVSSHTCSTNIFQGTVVHSVNSIITVIT